MNKPERPGAGPAADILHDRDFIVIYRGLDRAPCEAVVQRFDADPGKRPGRIGAGGSSAYVRDDKIS
ncbi:hypothetical protein ACG04R_08485 [Roseateles sp. BYS78W]|uniref:Uncharacterized protein n=1 Tax=Pelomonas candidula TaxID=3299025 RepID=A0ABW7H9W4_9BURK